MTETYLRAWETKWNEYTSIVLACTPGQAKAATFRSAKDANFNIAWNDIRCKRAVKYDVLLLSTTRQMIPLLPEIADQIKKQYQHMEVQP